MDRTARFGERFDRLTDVYKCFLTGSCPTQSVADVASVINSGVCGLVLGNNKCVSSEYKIALTCNCLTLVEKITSNLTSHSQLLDVNSYYTELLGMLFFNMDLMSQLVNQFQTEDQIISHLAAKSASTGVFFHIHKSGTVSPVWLRTCVQAFYSSAPGIELDACLWSLTEVIKRLHRGAFQGILEKLVAAVDSSLCALCSKFLTKKAMVTQCLDSTRARQWTTTFCLFLDLLEVLTASSLIPGSGVCLKSQRLTHIHSSALLATIGYATRYFVKKRVLLLLKRTVLETVGEDWALRENFSTGPKFKCFSSDISMLAEAVLAAVAANWLHSVQVKPASFFGGTRHIRYDGQKPDCVMLRAASLLLLKSMELHIQTAGATAELNSALKLNGYLQRLWCFLRQCSLDVWMPETTHLCCLVSLVFEEQDDDMMEATKALLSIFLHHRQLSGLDKSHVLEEACASGCNPHCHFLILLRRVFFDHSILLDFLISTETCFLEYFVRYLKFLTVDWQGFDTACQRISISDSHLSLLTSLTSSCDSVVYAQAYKGQPLVKNISLTTVRRLVEYESSDESDQEYVEIFQDKPETSVCENIKLNALHLTKSTGPHIKPLSLQNMSEQQTCKNTTYLANVTCQTETSLKTIICLSKLREVVMRLQTKNLFPYNPSSLLKLLERVQKCSQQSQL